MLARGSHGDGHWMLAEYSSWPSMILEAFRSASSLGYRPRGRLVIACGMGGSGFAAEAAGLLLEEAGIALVVERSHLPPGYVGPGVDVVGVSFSGETVETLLCVREAAARGARVAAVAGRGSRLARLVSSLGGTVYEYPARGAARTALAGLAGAVAGLLAGHALEGRVEAIARSLDPEAARGEAERAAGFILSMHPGRRLTVSSCGRLALASLRWRQELAENGKIEVYAEAYPEAGHNSVSAWSGRCLEERALILVRGAGDPLCRAIEDCLLERHCGGNAHVVDVSRQASIHPLAGLLQSSMIAGMAGVYVALRRGLDPGRNPEIERFRRLVGDAAGRL